jgi:charged multivesicular body protein 6
MLEKRIEADIIVARTLIVQKKKERALLALKKKKLSENQLQNIQAYLMNVEGMLSDMELTKQQSNVMAALKQGNEALKKAQQEMPLDDIQSLMDETAEAKEYQDKVQDLLSQQLDAADNESVLQELQQLEDLALQEEMQHMPSVPKTEPQQAQQQQQVQPAAEAAGAQAAVQLEEELPSVPKTKVAVETEELRQLEEPLPAS